MNNAIFYLQQAVPLGSSRYYSTVFCSAEDKKLLHALYALQDALHQLLEIKEPTIALTKWHWWYEEIQRLTNHQAQHPLTQFLQQTWPQLNFQPLTDTLNSLRLALQTPYCQTKPQFIHACQHRYGEFIKIFYQAHHGIIPSTNDYLTAISTINGITLGIKNLAHHLTKQRCELPLATCPDEQALYQLNLTPSLKTWLHEWVKEVDSALKLAEQTIPGDKHYHPSLLLARLQQRWLHYIAKKDFPIFKEMKELNPLHQLWIVCRQKTIN